MENIIFGGAVLSMIIVVVTVIVCLSVFLWKCSLDVIEGFKKDFNKGYKDAMESE